MCLPNLFARSSLAILIAVALLVPSRAVSAAGSVIEAAAKSKKTGLPMFVMFSGPGCVHCVNMKKRLQSEPELTKLITTQYVFVEASPGDSESKQFIEHYKIQVSGIPHSCIVSAKGELVDEAKGAPQGDGLKQLLLKGIEKTGGFKSLASANPKKTTKITKLEPEELEGVLKQVAEAKEKLDGEETALEGMVTLLGLNRTYTKIKEVTKEIVPTFATLNKDKAQAAILSQARMLDAAAAAVEQKKEKQAINSYNAVIKKFPDSTAAKFAQEKLDELKNGEADAKPTADAQASTKNEPKKSEETE
jgi:hypothetical protein